MRLGGGSGGVDRGKAGIRRAFLTEYLSYLKLEFCIILILNGIIYCPNMRCLFC